MSLIEAHASAVPVVSTDVGGVRAVVNNGSLGPCDPTERRAAFADAVTELSRDGARAKAFGLAGRANVAETFTLERLVGDLDTSTET